MFLLSPLANLIIRLFGWRFVGSPPAVPRAVGIGAFHTSNTDGFWFIMAVLAKRLPARFLVKHTLLQSPVGWIWPILGAIPVNRESGQGVVEQVADLLKHNDMFLCIAPEGTRRKVTRWKRGFYEIARAAGVPIMLTALDYKRKLMIFGPMFEPTGDLEADAEIIRSFYKDITPRYPERAGTIAFSHSHAERHHDDADS